MDKLFLKNEVYTEILGEIIAKNIGGNIVIALEGGLGAGKTFLTKSIVKNLGIDMNVTSPTFNLMNIYEGDKVNCYHFDFYRLEDENELENIGFYEYSNLGVSIIEWADKFVDVLPLNYILINIEYSEDKKSRYAYLKAVGKKYMDIVENISREYKERSN